MDFVVVGLGVGALAILLGLTMREAATRWSPIRPDQALPPARVARRVAIGRAGRAGGLVISLAGGVIVVVTFVALVLGLSDRVGAIIVMAAISVAVLGSVPWGIAYAHRYHPRRVPAGRRPAPSIDEPASLSATIDTASAQLASGAATLPTATDQSEEPAETTVLDVTAPSAVDADAGTAADRPLATRNGEEPPVDLATVPDTDPDADPIPAHEAGPCPVAHATARKDDGS